MVQELICTGLTLSNCSLECINMLTLAMLVIIFLLEEQGTRKRVAFRSEGGEGKSDEGTPLSSRVTIGDDSSLTIKVVQPSDELTYICQVTAGPAGVGDGATQLKVFFAPEKPELTKPSSQAIYIGGSESSEVCNKCVSMNGHPQPRIIWFKDNNPLAEVKDKTQETYMVPSVVKEASGLFTIQSTLYMRPTKADKDSVFYCVVEYLMPQNQIRKKMSDKISINLNYPSETATFVLLNTTPVKEGDTVTMKCETDGNPQPEFDFTKDGNNIKGEGGLLTLKSVKRTDAGEYMCQATDFDNLDADLNIDPVSVTPVEPQVVMLGDKVEWQCKTKASAAHTVHWKKVSSITRFPMIKQESMCVGAVPSVPGLTAEASVNLTVKGKPVIESPAVAEVEKEGDTVTLKCSAYGLPSPQFTWKPSGKESVSPEGNKMVSTMTLKATAEVMKNGVICEVSNEHGSDSAVMGVALKRALVNSDRGRAFSLLLLLSSLLFSGLFVVQTL
uniref:Ig-like domain-containing protein n=1 Tax=Sphaeramia orbicularis TaxID=375764 RepID=A0A672YDG1_9TELE